MKRIVMSVVVSSIALLAPFGCAKYPLQALMTDSQIRAVLDENFSVGMTTAAVQSELEHLRVPAGQQLMYPAEGPRPPVLLARVYQPGGAWLDGGDSTISFVDLSFVFEPPDSLSRMLLYRDGVRYLDGFPRFGPSRPTREPVRPYPAPIPPPVDPLLDAH